MKVIEVFHPELEELHGMCSCWELLWDGEETILEQWDFNHFCSIAPEFGYFCV